MADVFDRMSKFNADQQMAYDAANLEQRVRGMPDHTARDFMLMRPGLFPGLEAGSLEVEPTPPPVAPLGSRRSNGAARAAAEAAQAAELSKTAEASKDYVPPQGESVD